MMEENFSVDEQDNPLQQSAKNMIYKETSAFLTKVRYVILMLPKHREQSVNCLRKWDMWGPMLICLFFAIPMSVVNQDPFYEQDFINVFLIFWIGSLLVSFNCKLLGSKGSLFLIVSSVGYSMLPLALIAFTTSLMHSLLHGVVKFSLLIFGLSWSSIACMLVMRDLVSQERKWLCTYPIFLFYLFLGWYAIVA